MKDTLKVIAGTAFIAFALLLSYRYANACACRWAKIDAEYVFRSSNPFDSDIYVTVVEIKSGYVGYVYGRKDKQWNGQTVWGKSCLDFWTFYTPIESQP